MVIKYSRLISDATAKQSNYLRWVKTKLPLAFLRQQVPLVSIVIASFLLLILTQLFTKNNLEHDLRQGLSKDTQFGVIVDCGSSGTRAHIFKWLREDNSIAHIELVRDVQSGKPLSKHIVPGLSSLSNDPDKASEYMEPIMNFISNTIPDDWHLDTPVYFLATAGMRLLDDSIQKKILFDITRDLRVKYDFPRIKSQVITGEFEGIYSWLSLNMGKIYNTTMDHSAKTYGMIELGGASAQVAFELNPEVENYILENLQGTDAITTFKSEQVTLNLGHNRSVKLFATTFLGLGVNSARESAIDLLARDYLIGTGQFDSQTLDLKNFAIQLQDPCLTVGSSEVLLRPHDMIYSRNQSVGFVVKQPEKTFKVELKGSGNFLNCITLLERVLQAVKTERLNCLSPKGSCSMSLLGSDFIPYQHYPFVGLSEMFFTTNEMIHLAGVFNRSKILHETNRICSTDYNKLHEIYANSKVSYQDRILYECFKASWMLTLLHSSGFKMPSSYENFVTAEQVEGREIDWTVGAMINEIVLNNNGH